jgi:hypothetical protein
MLILKSSRKTTPTPPYKGGETPPLYQGGWEGCCVNIALTKH